MAWESEAAEYSEGYESEGIGEWSEAARGGRRGPRTATGKNLAPAPVSKNFVTFTDLRTALDKVGGQLKTNADAIGAVSAKLASTTANLKKEFDERKKDMESARKNTDSKVQMLALLPLLIQPPTYTIAQNAFSAGVPSAPVPLNPPAAGMLNALLPLLLVGGFGGSGGLGGGTDGGMDGTNLLVLALVLSQSQNQTSHP
jgi:hypothetical protein